MKVKSQLPVWTYLHSVILRVSSCCKQSQDSFQEFLINLHRHLLNQSHEVPEEHGAELQTHLDSPGHTWLLEEGSSLIWLCGCYSLKLYDISVLVEPGDYRHVDERFGF